MMVPLIKTVKVKERSKIFFFFGRREVCVFGYKGFKGEYTHTKKNIGF